MARKRVWHGLLAHAQRQRRLPSTRPGDLQLNRKEPPPQEYTINTELMYSGQFGYPVHPITEQHQKVLTAT